MAEKSQSSTQISKAATIFGYITAILTGASLILSQSINIKKYFFPRISLSLISYSSDSELVVINSGESNIYLSALVTESDQEEALVAIGKHIKAGETLIHEFKQDKKLYREFVKNHRATFLSNHSINGYSLDVMERINTLQPQKIDADNECIMPHFSSKNYSGFQLLKKNMGPNLHVRNFDIRLIAFDLNSGKEILHNKILGTGKNKGRQYYMKISAKCD